MAELHTRLTAPGRAGPRVVALHGMGGAGKTTVAVEYAYRLLAGTGIVWQFTAENPAVLASEFASLAGLLGVHQFLDGRDPVGAVHAVLAAGAVPWLLIFDNVPAAAAVARFLPPAGTGRIVITSQNPHWPSDQAMEVPVLSADDAAGFLASRTGSADQEPAAVALAAELGGLPLALEQAAAYILASGSTLAGYLELFRRHRSGLLARGGPHGYGKTIATTWSLAFTELDQQAPQAAALLRLLACCAPEPVPVGTLLRLAPGTARQLPADLGHILAPLLEDELAANDAIAELRRFSLITFAGHGKVLMHRLVQAATVDRMTVSQADSWRQAAAALVEAALPPDPKVARDWLTFAALLPHAKAVLGESSAGLARVVDYLGWSGDISAARDQLTVLLAAQTRILGADHQVTLATGHDLACWTGQAGDPANARDRLAASLPEAERALGSEHAITLLTRHSLAYWTGRAGGAAAARDQFAALLPVRERVLGPEHPDTLATRSSLASWIGQAADPSAAARDQLIAQPVSEQDPGPAARGDIATQNDHARWVGQAAAPAAAACDQLTILLPIRERILGHDHLTTLLTRHELARWTGEAGDPAAARDQLADLLPARERVLGPRHPDSLATRSYLARWTGLAGDPAAARDQLADLLPARERVLGPRHPDTLVTRHNLAHWTGQAGDPAAARDQLADLLPARERVLGPRHPDTLVTRHNLAHWTGQAGDPAAARDQLAALQPDIEQVLGPDHPITTAARTTHAWWTQQAAQASDQQPPCQS